MPQRPLNTIDLFAGCGGLMDGFEKEGAFRTLACVEWERAPCENLVHRLKSKWQHANAESEVVRFDIQRTEELFAGFRDPEYGTRSGLDDLVKNRKVDILIGGPPCQAYSLAGRIRDENGMRNDYRNYLFESYLKVVDRYKPDFFLFENVVGLLSAAPDGTPIVDRIRQSFNDAGYGVIDSFEGAVFNLPEFGIPQNRKRIIILGVRKESFANWRDIIADFYGRIMPSFHSAAVTVEEAIGDLPKYQPLVVNGRVVYAPMSPVRIANHIPRAQSVRDVKVFKLLTEDIESGRKQYVSIDALKRLYTETTGKVSNIHKYYVLRRDEQSNTIPAHLFKDGLRHIHPDSVQCRTLTVREAARLQTFDDDYEFIGSMADAYKMIGNAVPPRFSLLLARAMREVYERYGNVELMPPNADIRPDEHVHSLPYQMMLFEASVAPAAYAGLPTLMATYRQSCREWIEKKLRYNYPIDPEDKTVLERLRRVKRIVLVRRTDKPMMFDTNGCKASVATKEDLLKMGYPSGSNHSSKQLYLLFPLKRRNFLSPLFDPARFLIRGIGTNRKSRKRK